MNKKCYLTAYNVTGGCRVDLGIKGGMGISYHTGAHGYILIKENNKVVSDKGRIISFDVDEDGFNKFIRFLEKKDLEDRSRILKENLRFIGTVLNFPLPSTMEV